MRAAACLIAALALMLSAVAPAAAAPVLNNPAVRNRAKGSKAWGFMGDSESSKGVQAQAPIMPACRAFPQPHTSGPWMPGT